MIFRRRPRPNPLPYGEPGYPDYWIEAMKRAYQLGEPRALHEIERLTAITGMHPPMESYDSWFPYWFHGIWSMHISPISHADNAMPY